jgi:hypothetical protein
LFRLTFWKWLSSKMAWLYSVLIAYHVSQMIKYLLIWAIWFKVIRNFIHKEYNYGVSKSKFSSGGQYSWFSVLQLQRVYWNSSCYVISLLLIKTLTQDFDIQVKRYLNVSLLNWYCSDIIDFWMIGTYKSWQWRSQPNDSVPLCKYCHVYDNQHNQFLKKWIMIMSWNLHSRTKSSGWLRQWWLGTWHYTGLSPMVVSCC